MTSRLDNPGDARQTRGMIQITPELSIHEDEIKEHFIRAGGPGGQHVNKASTAVQLRFDVDASSLPAQIKKRLAQQAKSRINEHGVLVIRAQSHRSQESNREEARARLVQIIRNASRRPKARKKTKPTRAARERRLREKKHRSAMKRLRSSRPNRDE